MKILKENKPLKLTSRPWRIGCLNTQRNQILFHEAIIIAYIIYYKNKTYLDAIAGSQRSLRILPAKVKCVLYHKTADDSHP